MLYIYYFSIRYSKIQGIIDQRICAFLILKYWWNVLHYVRPSYIPTLPLIKRRSRVAQSLEVGLIVSGWCRRLQLGSLKLCGGNMLRLGVDFFLGLLLCVFSLALSLSLWGRWTCCFGRHGPLPWTKWCLLCDSFLCLCRTEVMGTGLFYK